MNGTPRRKALLLKEQAVLAHELARALQLMGSVEDALASMEGSGRSAPYRLFLARVRVAMADGRSLGEAIEQEEAVSEVFRIAAAEGEKQGVLLEMLERVAAHLGRAARVRALHRRGAMAAALCACGATASFCIFVGAQLFIRNHTPLFSAQMASAFWILMRWPLAALGAIAVVWAVAGAIRPRFARAVFVGLEHWVPVLGRLRWSGSMAQFHGALSVLLSCGLEPPEAIIVAAAAAGDPVLEGHTVSSRAQLARGEPLHEALANLPYARADDTWMGLRRGERTGLVRGLALLSAMHEARCRRAAGWLSILRNMGLACPFLVFYIGLAGGALKTIAL